MRRSDSRQHFLHNLRMAGPLTEAEAKLLDSLEFPETNQQLSLVSRGGGVKIRHGDTVRANLLRTLCTSPQLSRGPRSRGIVISEARIIDPLDLSFARITSPLTFENCVIKHPIKLHHSRLVHLAFRGGQTRDLYANGAVIEGDFVLGGGIQIHGTVSLVNARVNGSLKFSGAAIHKRNGMAVECDDIDVGGSVYLDEEFTALGEVRLANASVRGCINCEARLISQGFAFYAEFARIQGSILLRKSRVSGEVSLFGVRCNGSIEFDGGIFRNPQGDSINLDNSFVRGCVFMREGFRAKGQVRMVGANVGLDLDCEGGDIVSSPLSTGKPRGTSTAFCASRMRLKGNLTLESFQALGEVRLKGAYIGGSLRATSTRLLIAEPTPATQWIGAQTMNAEGITVVGSIEICECSTNGIFDLRNAHIGRNVGFKNLALHDKTVTGLIAEFARIDGELAWIGTVAQTGTKLMLSHARIGRLRHGRLSWTIGKGRACFTGCVYGTIDFEDIRELPASTPIQPASESTQRNWLQHGKATGNATVESIEWLQCQNRGPFDPQPYEQLIRVLHRSGRDDEATQTAVALHEARYAFHYGKMRRSERWLNRTLKHLLHFGHSTRPLCWASVGMVLLSTVLFWAAYTGGAMHPSSEEQFLDSAYVNSGVVPESYQAFSPLWYSVDSFVPVIDLHQERYWLPNSHVTCEVIVFGWQNPFCGRLFRWYLWAHIMLGWLATTFIVISVSGIIRRLPTE